jgi:hypothetical protein
MKVIAVRAERASRDNEWSTAGAGKGILVTTSHFGASASEFAKDKPMTLIDGSQLLHLMQTHGHNVRIDVSEATDDQTLGIIRGGN